MRGAVPKRTTGATRRALVVELKWSRNTRAAMGQVRDRDYAQVLRDWGGPVLLVGITYDPKSNLRGDRSILALIARCDRG